MRKFLYGFLSILLLTTCKKDETSEIIEVDPAFTGYVSAFTSGVISNEDNIQIRLREPVDGIVTGEELDQDIFDFTPSIEGKAHWVSNSIIEFTPEDILPSGKLFEATFHLGEVIEVPDKLEELTFQFETMKQYINVNFDGLEAYDRKNLKWQKLKGQLLTADYAYDDKVEKTLKAAQGGKKIKLKWQHAADGRSHSFVIDSVERGKSANQVVLEWDGDPINSESEGEEVIEIPPLGDFKVMDIRLTQQPDQYITFFFSDPLKENQELEGLIYLKSGEHLRFVIEDNTVRAYPANRLVAQTEIVVNKGVQNSMGYQLKEVFTRQVKFSSIKPDVELIGDGVILPSTDGLIFPFKAVNLNGVNVKVLKIFEDNISQFLQVNQLDGRRQLKRVGRIIYKDEIELKALGAVDYGAWNTFALDLSSIIKVDPGAIYRVSIGFDRKHSLYPCQSEDAMEEEVDYLLEDPEIVSYDDMGSGYYNDYYYNYNDGYQWRERNDPCKPSYYMRNQHTVIRNVLASDLGVIAKGGDANELLVAVTDLKTTESISGVTVELYNLQHQLITTATTNAEGMASIPHENKPFLLVAKHGQQRGYLRLDDGSALSLSMFDVGGTALKTGMKGFIYGERGVWRPGDSLYVSFMLEDKLNRFPEDHPVVFELYTPQNQLYLRKVSTRSVKGIYDFRTVTKQEAPTGNWLAKVKVGQASFTKTIKIETVKPNRLKINFSFEDEILKSGEQASGELAVKWLHGAIAKNLKADIEVTLTEGKAPFGDYKEYIFNDPIQSFESESEIIFEGQLNEQGKAIVNTSFNVKDQAPGMLKANFKIRAFEQGGNFSVDRLSKPFSPYQSYVGVKIPKGKGWRDALYSNESNLFPIVTLDENGKPVSREKLKVEIYSIGWRWWWQRDGRDDLSSYIRNRSSSLIKTAYVSTGADGKVMYDFNLGQRSWGRKLIRITDPVSGHSTGEIFYTSYRGWWNSGQEGPGGAEMLTFKTNKEKYVIGEDVKVTLPANEEGRALVSLESGSKVVDAFWVEPGENNSTFSFKATPEMAPNVFVHVSYIQPHNITVNDLPIRMYGVQSVKVEDPGTHVNPVINMPDVLEPEKKFSIEVSESDGKGMAYTVAVVDEGLLDLTRFKTPNPWNYFYAREALGVKTWDMYKYVVGALSGEMSGLLAIGGDEELIAKEGGEKANRFKPVVKFAGPFYLAPGKSARHTFTMPNYVGSVRAMVVAGGGKAYGNAEKTVPVKKPLMVLATLPRVIGPGESVKVPVTVFAMDDKIRNVKVSLQSNDLFHVIGNDSKNIRFTEQGDQVIYFDLEARKKIGVGKVAVTVSGHGERAKHETEMDVRLANPPLTKFQEAAIEPGESWSANYDRIGVRGTNKATLEVSTFPSLNLEDRLDYLIRYPHGCVEQITSSVFPQLHLSNLMELSKDREMIIEDNIRSAIEKLRNFQQSNGSMSYWPGYYSYYNEWGTNYAGHFMLEAEAEGYSLPIGFKQKWLRFQTQRANDWDNQVAYNRRWYYRANQLIQAYRLYTLALAGKPALGAMNRMKEIRDLKNAARWRLAAAYQLAGRNKVAQEIINNAEIDIDDYRELGYTYGSTTRDHAMVLETLVIMDEKARAKKLMDELVEKIGSRRWYSTQTVSYTLLAIAKFVGTKGEKNFTYAYTINGNGEKSITLDKSVNQHKLNFAGKTASIKNQTDQTIFVNLINEGIPLETDQIDEENDLRMHVTYLNMDGQPIDVNKLEQGTDFMAEVTVKHPGVRSEYKEMALTQIFPSGWEIRNLRMDLTTDIDTGDDPEYQDIRDDRVYTYFDLNAGESKTFRVVLNAAYLGRFYLPAVQCGAMYDNDISAYKSGQWVEVMPAGGNVQ
ncbi:MAG: MG2 domain-containing protein [Fulvivirga sp.]|nr:MG2 domain-containing protein [Fulvivirga sp.]